MFRFLIICVTILVNVEAAPSADPQLDIFVRIEILIVFFLIILIMKMFTEFF